MPRQTMSPGPALTWLAWAAHAAWPCAHLGWGSSGLPGHVHLGMYRLRRLRLGSPWPRLAQGWAWAWAWALAKARPGLS
eukprot:359189-Chlamydomonas_euryale.AAC.4